MMISRLRRCFRRLGSTFSQFPAFPWPGFKNRLEIPFLNHTWLFCSVQLHRWDRHLVHVAIPRPEAQSVRWDKLPKRASLTQPVWLRASPANWRGLCRKSRHSQFSLGTSGRFSGTAILTFPGWLPSPITSAASGSPISPTTTWRSACLFWIGWRTWYRHQSCRDRAIVREILEAHNPPQGEHPFRLARIGAGHKAFMTRSTTPHLQART